MTKALLFILMSIALFIVIMAVFLMPFVLARIFFYKWVRHTHPDYDRDLTEQESRYIHQAQTALAQLQQNGKYPSIKYTFICLAPIPCLFLVGILLVWLSQQTPDIVSGSMVAIYSLIGLCFFVGCALLNIWTCYFSLRRSIQFMEWLVLYNSQGDQTESTPKRRLAQIEHDVRIRRLDVLSNFLPSEFLQGIYRRHQRYTGIAACIFLALAISLGFLAKLT